MSIRRSGAAADPYTKDPLNLLSRVAYSWLASCAKCWHPNPTPTTTPCSRKQAPPFCSNNQKQNKNLTQKNQTPLFSSPDLFTKTTSQSYNFCETSTEITEPLSLLHPKYYMVRIRIRTRQEGIGNSSHGLRTASRNRATNTVGAQLRSTDSAAPGGPWAKYRCRPGKRKHCRGGRQPWWSS